MVATTLLQTGGGGGGGGRKLSPRKSGPWIILAKKQNGVNFEIVNDKQQMEIIHHDRLIPVKGTTHDDMSQQLVDLDNPQNVSTSSIHVNDYKLFASLTFGPCDVIKSHDLATVVKDDVMNKYPLCSKYDVMKNIYLVQGVR